MKYLKKTLKFFLKPIIFVLFNFCNKYIPSIKPLIKKNIENYPKLEAFIRRTLNKPKHVITINSEDTKNKNIHRALSGGRSYLKLSPILPISNLISNIDKGEVLIIEEKINAIIENYNKDIRS